jgi:hypothetical protein
MRGMGAGISKDAKDTWHNINKVDKWIEKNWW